MFVHAPMNPQHRYTSMRCQFALEHPSPGPMLTETAHILRYTYSLTPTKLPLKNAHSHKLSSEIVKQKFYPPR